MNRLSWAPVMALSLGLLATLVYIVDTLFLPSIHVDVEMYVCVLGVGIILAVISLRE